MKVDIIPIGNSKGIRIPKALLEQCGFVDSIEMLVESQEIILRSPRAPRQGWEESIRRSIAKHGKEESVWPDDMQDPFGDEA